MIYSYKQTKNIQTNIKKLNREKHGKTMKELIKKKSIK